jgi:dihydroorotase
MSKFLLLGLSLEEVLTKTTTTPARLLGVSEQIGSLREGSIADIAVFRLSTGEFEFEDSMNQKRLGQKKLEPMAVIRGGKLWKSLLRLERRVDT